MKLIKYIVVSLLLLVPIESLGCFWPLTHAGDVLLYRIMPLNENEYYQYKFYGDVIFHKTANYEDEMIALWKQQTSSSISTEDVRHIVYKANNTELQNIKKKSSKNSFAKWLVANNRIDIINYLIIAKQCESVVSSMRDPWYYGVDGDKQSLMLENIVKRCRAYKKGPLLNRYVLQLIRALFAQRKYQECVDVWNKNESRLANNVIRKIAELKVAGALNKTGKKHAALKIYAKYGDVGSIRTLNYGKINNELEFVYNLQPNSPYIPDELQNWLIFLDNNDTIDKNDTIYNGRFMYDNIRNIIKVANKAVRNKKTKNKAMWYYTLAALYDRKGENHKALSFLNCGEKYLRTSFLRDSYRILRMYLEAKTSAYNADYEQKLFTDLKWLVSKVENEKPKDFKEKFMPDNTSYIGGYQDCANTYYWNDAMRRILLRVVCPRMHKAKNYVREVQLANLADNLLMQVNGYSNEMFQIMERQTYSQTKEYFYRIYHPQDDFDTYLNSKGKIGKYYWYDILATKCMREQRYSKAIVYLRQIPLSFQKGMDVYYYMNKDPFSYDRETFKSVPSLAENYKIHFAQRMDKYQRLMKFHHNPNVRADAKIMYAIGLRNSVHRCWCLTRYSSNWENNGVKYRLPEINYPSDATLFRCEKYKELSDKLINQAINTYRNKEKAARQLQKLLYFKRILDDFGETETAQRVRSTCDRWRDYVPNTRLSKKKRHSPKN